MIRDVSQLRSGKFDVVVIGGGIYGSWIAYHAAMAGLKVALVEKSDWGSATSSASSKLLHGGLRYLERYEVSLVRKSLHERRELSRLFPHLVRPLRFLLPVYRDSRVGMLRLKAGLWLYDRLAGPHQPVDKHVSFSAAQLVECESALKPDRLVGGFSYGDCGTDDARMVLEVVDSAMQAGVAACHYVAATDLLKPADRVTGVRLCDVETNETFDVNCSMVINAAGPWVFQQFGLGEKFTDNASVEPTAGPTIGDRVRLTKGVHLVMPELNSDHAVLLTAKADGRVFFLIPWYGRTLLGTTDTDYHGDPAMVRVEQSDITYLLNAANDYLQTSWTADDIYGAYVGLRTLQNEIEKTASGVSREWAFEETLPGLLTSVGGKYTSARVDAAEAVGKILDMMRQTSATASVPENMAWYPGNSFSDWKQRQCQLAVDAGIDQETAMNGANRFGSRFKQIVELVKARPDLANRIVADLPFCRAEIVFSVTDEMARSLMDILRRRIPLMLLTRLNRPTLEDVCDLVEEYFEWDAAERERQIVSVLEMSGRWLQHQN